MMEEIFKNLGKKAGQSLRRGKWLYKSVLGSEEEAIRAEYFVGKEIYADIIKRNEIEKDVRVSDLLDNTGKRLTGRLTNKFRQYRFNSIVSPDINAFALPGGFVFTTSSILSLCGFDENEVAFILGHEIGHIVKWHIFNRTVANSSLNFISMVSKPAGLISSTAVSVVNSLMQNSYSQNQEMEADEFGATLVFAAGYDPNAALTVLGKLQEKESAGHEFFNYFSTHPLGKDRINNIEKLIRRGFKK